MQKTTLAYYAIRHSSDYIADLFGMTEEVFIASLEADQELAAEYKKARMGRRRVTLTKTQMDELSYYSARCTDEQIAALYGMDEQVFKKIIKDDPELYRQYKKGKAEMSLAVTNVLLDSIINDKNMTSVYFYKKCVDGWQEKSKDDVVEQAPPTVTVKVIGTDGQIVNPDNKTLTSDNNSSV